MTSQPRSTQLRDWLVPGSPSDPQLLHAEASDHILVCPPDVGQGYVQEIPLRHDLILVILDYTLHRDIVIDAVGTGDRIEFEFHLAGPYAGYSLSIPSIKLSQLGIKRSQKRFFKVEVFFKQPSLTDYAQFFIERLSPQARATAEQILQSIYRYQDGGSSSSIDQMVSRIFTPDRPQNALAPLASPSIDQILTDGIHAETFHLNYATHSPMTPAMRSHIEQILSCPYRGKTRRTYLEDRALQLVDLRLDAILHTPCNTSNLRCVSQAAAILREQLVEPPTLEALARQVGTNRLTLTQGFHTLYGTSPFGYLRDLRLMQARRLLMTSEMSITDIAAAVGYTSRSRFATAFRQKTGINPKAFQLRAWQTAG